LNFVSLVPSIQVLGNINRRLGLKRTERRPRRRF
jgi:hypothetical protein